MERVLVLVRHGQSLWNRSGRFTGRQDPDLSERGVAEAREAGRRLQALGLRLDAARTSTLIRARRTCALILEEMGQPDLEVRVAPALDERDLGALSGLTKVEARARWGRDRVRLWRRDPDGAPPGGETARQVAARALPCLRQEILPRVGRGERVMVVAHHDVLCALAPELDRRAEAGEAPGPAFATGVPVLYRLAPDGAVRSREVVDTPPFRRFP